MAKKPICYHFARVESGKLVFADLPLLNTVVRNLEGKDVRLTLERKPAARKNSSDAQRRYYFGVICQIIGGFVGVTPDEAHDLLKAEFLTVEVEKAGYKFKVIRSTESLSTIEREEYHSNIRMWASINFGCYVPLPNEITY